MVGQKRMKNGEVEVRYPRARKGRRSREMREEGRRNGERRGEERRDGDELTRERGRPGGKGQGDVEGWVEGMRGTERRDKCAN